MNLQVRLKKDRFGQDSETAGLGLRAKDPREPVFSVWHLAAEGGYSSACGLGPS